MSHIPHVSQKIAPYAVLVTLRTGEKVRTLWGTQAGAESEAAANHGGAVKSAIVERNTGSEFVPLEMDQ